MGKKPASTTVRELMFIPLKAANESYNVHTAGSNTPVAMVGRIYSEWFVKTLPTMSLTLAQLKDIVSFCEGKE